MSRLKQYLIQEAKHHNVCIDGLRGMSERNIDELVDYYIQNADWCIENNYPNYDTLKNEFAHYEHKGVFVDKKFNGEEFKSQQVYIFHNCEGVINVAIDLKRGIIPALYFANNCAITISCKQKECLLSPIKVPLYVFGNNIIATKQTPYAQFTTYKIQTQ